MNVQLFGLRSMNSVYVPGRDGLAVDHQRHLGLQLRRDVRACSPDRRVRIARSSRRSHRCPEDVAAALDRTAEGELDPLAALVDRTFGSVHKLAADLGAAAVPVGLAGRPPCAHIIALSATVAAPVAINLRLIRSPPVEFRKCRSLATKISPSLRRRT